ncbi:MAG TPA: hypothetical protein VG960_11170 [Caulobacteraceae bacterium]|nr:hypothetical protein [Caulobacteraceae bacterium]
MLWPLAIAWLAVHGALLAIIIGLKFLGAKTVALLLLLGAVFWLAGRRKPSLPRLSSVV